jgi:predicted esterase YcpF (UPF0227 family)
MVILYLCGFGSRFSEENDKVIALKHLGEVKGIDLDYTKSKEINEERILNFLFENPDVDCIIGTSLGGYYAAVVGAKIGLPFVSINPTMDPNVSLMKYVGPGRTYFGENYFLESVVVNGYDHFPLKGCGMILLDFGDEVLDSNKTKNKLEKKFTVHTFNDGHHRFAHINESINYIKDFVKRSELVYEN